LNRKPLGFLLAVVAMVIRCGLQNDAGPLAVAEGR